jgi:hypothetical protein
MKRVAFLCVAILFVFAGCLDRNRKEAVVVETNFLYLGKIVEAPIFHTGYANVTKITVETLAEDGDRERFHVLLVGNTGMHKKRYQEEKFIALGDTVCFEKVDMYYEPKPSSAFSPHSIPIGIFVPTNSISRFVKKIDDEGKFSFE